MEDITSGQWSICIVKIFFFLQTNFAYLITLNNILRYVLKVKLVLFVQIDSYLDLLIKNTGMITVANIIIKTSLKFRCHSFWLTEKLAPYFLTHECVCECLCMCVSSNYVISKIRADHCILWQTEVILWILLLL